MDIDEETAKRIIESLSEEDRQKIRDGIGPEAFAEALTKSAAGMVQFARWLCEPGFRQPPPASVCAKAAIVAVAEVLTRAGAGPGEPILAILREGARAAEAGALAMSEHMTGLIAKAKGRAS